MWSDNEIFGEKRKHRQTIHNEIGYESWIFAMVKKCEWCKIFDIFFNHRLNDGKQSKVDLSLNGIYHMVDLPQLIPLMSKSDQEIYRKHIIKSHYKWTPDTKLEYRRVSLQPRFQYIKIESVLFNSIIHFTEYM